MMMISRRPLLGGLKRLPTAFSARLQSTAPGTEAAAKKAKEKAEDIAKWEAQREQYNPKKDPLNTKFGKWFQFGLIFTIGATVGSGYISYKVGENPPSFLFPSSSTTKLEELVPAKYGSVDSKVLAELELLLGSDQISQKQQQLDEHSDTYWNSHHAEAEQRPICVVYPQTTEQVSGIMKICHSHRIPVVPFSGGTSLEGHFIPTRGGICIDLSAMNNILALHKEDLDIMVQPCVGWEELDDYLSEYGLMFGPDPGPGAMIGGMIGTSCSGTNAARYGTMKENVVSLTVVLADGTVLKTKKRPRKSSAGYNLNGLFIGSEGTLGIVTEATLKLYVRPKFEHVAVVSFPKIDDAANTVSRIVAEGITVNAMELLDDRMMHFINESGGVSQTYKEAPTLFFKLGGETQDSVRSLVKKVQAIVKENNCASFKFAEDAGEKAELWSARKVALWSTMDYGRKKISQDIQLWTTDVAVPISKLCELLVETKQDMEDSGLAASLVGHAGDGNFHAFLLFKPEQRPIAETLVERMVQRALKYDGTCTGEHGVGFGKRSFLEEELGSQVVDAMRKVKLALDPYRLLNPDKVFRIDPAEKSEH
ncbi:unnamed protein product [Kuraishia capsulata CBS 1993]|uniref:D-lactate dehydrogenase (cytochrome) n=1 Tax=Kuraishia capsulata CBS 1993 TaxID=1382522 RepID=W6MUG3_9ASCO|nr:uncharacterized protein KUCA_T00005245001 [Kuraishia capsulata CBS 1993]CDK29257.1 unnamed protein product [Kuraishia capsulata CBS 1993]